MLWQHACAKPKSKLDKDLEKYDEIADITDEVDFDSAAKLGQMPNYSPQMKKKLMWKAVIGFGRGLLIAVVAILAFAYLLQLLGIGRPKPKPSLETQDSNASEVDEEEEDKVKQKKKRLRKAD